MHKGYHFHLDRKGKDTKIIGAKNGVRRDRETLMNALLFFLDKYHKRIEEYLLAQAEKKAVPVPVASADPTNPGLAGFSTAEACGVEKARTTGEGVHLVLEELRKVLQSSYPIMREISPGKGDTAVARHIGDQLKLHRRKHSQQFTRSIFSADELREGNVGPVISSPTPSVPFTARSIRSSGSAIFPKTVIAPFASANRPHSVCPDNDPHIKVCCYSCVVVIVVVGNIPIDNGIDQIEFYCAPAEYIY